MYNFFFFLNCDKTTVYSVTQSCLTLCDTLDCSPPGSSIQGIFQARIREWVAIFFSRGPPQPRDQIRVPRIFCIGRWILYHWATREALERFLRTTNSFIQFSSVAQMCPTLCDSRNCSTPGLPVHHQPPEFTQTHVHRVGDAIQPSHPLSSPSPLSLNLSQYQGLFQ